MNTVSTAEMKPFKMNIPPMEEKMDERDPIVTALIERARRGDQQAFSRIMDLYRERVMRMALHMVGNREDANDLCQETFVRVYRALDTFDSSRAFTPWLYRIAHNVVYDHFRRKKARPALADNDPERPIEETKADRNAANPQDTVISEEVKTRIQAAIQSLPENYRDVVIFRFVDDLSYAEIAETLNLTEANVMMRMSRARRLLRDKLQYLQLGGLFS